MRPSRLFIAIAALFSASALAVGPPGSQGPRQDSGIPTNAESSQSMERSAEPPGITENSGNAQATPSAESLSDTAVAPSEERISQGPENSSMSTSPGNSWQSSAQRSEPYGPSSGASTPGDVQSVPSTPEASSAPTSDRENTRSPEEQSK